MRGRRLFATEVVQTSTMDCGPAALKSLLDGYRVPVSYGRLREACQTGVDGTSIDAVESVANQLGLDAVQVMIPVDHVFLEAACPLPAIVVVRHVDTATHFIVVWRRHGAWLQVMDPAIGRRWIRTDQLTQEFFRHDMRVAADEWRAWAASDEFVGALKGRMAALRIASDRSAALIERAFADAGWFAAGALDASVRLVQALVDADGVTRGDEAASLVASLFERTRLDGSDIYRFVPATYWSTTPDATNADPSREMLTMHGAVLVRIEGLRDGVPEAPPNPELAIALNERTTDPLATVWRLLREDGLLAPIALLGAIAAASGAVVLEALLFRGLFDLTAVLGIASQRLAAAFGLIAFLVVLLMIEMPIVLEAMRHGRHLEARLRIALLRMMPRLADRYFQSRPISDMAERSHSLHLVRNLPALALQFIQSMFELVLTFVGIVVIAPDSGWLAAALATTAIAVPMLLQPMLAERDLCVRNHAGALGGFTLDALLGLVPIRAHRAEHNVRRQHESLLVEWASSMRGWVRIALACDGIQSVLCTVLAGGLLSMHFMRAGGVAGPDLLLVFWTLKLPAIGSRLASLAQQYPAQRNTLLRLLEPIGAAEQVGEAVVPEPGQTDRIPGRLSSAADGESPGIAISIERGGVLVSGHEVLHDIDLAIEPGEHVAVVGVSGAGKSSLLGLLLGWHRLSSGRLAVDGMALRGEHLEALRRVTAWVDPAVQIWNRSLLENLQYAADDEELGDLGEVVELTRLRGLLEQLPHGLQTFLGEGGALLSGGEGQRVRLARALMMARPRLVLLDEPFRGLDRAQRQALLVESRRWWTAATLLCVTHDVAETLDFDRVLVVEHGVIVEDGSPQDLAAVPTRYAALLEAERKVRETLWQGDLWRRVGLHGGRLRTEHRTGAAA